MKNNVAIERDGSTVSIVITCNSRYEAIVMFDDLNNRAKKDGGVTIRMLNMEVLSEQK